MKHYIFKNKTQAALIDCRLSFKLRFIILI